MQRHALYFARRYIRRSSSVPCPTLEQKAVVAVASPLERARAVPAPLVASGLTTGLTTVHTTVLATVLTTVLTTVLALHVAPGLVHEAKADPVVKIGISVPLTGDAATYGTDIKNAAEFASKTLGHGRYELVIEDDQCTEQAAVTVAKKLVNVDKVKAVVGFGCSGAVLGAAPVYEKARVPVIASTTGAPAITSAGDYIFRTIPSLNVAAEKLYLHASKHFKTVGIISEETAYAQGLKAAFLARAQGQPLQVRTENYVPGTSDFRTQLTKLRTAGVEALFINPQAEAGLVTIIKQLRSLGWSPALYATYYPNSPVYLNAFGTSGDGIIFADLPFNEQMLSPEGVIGFKQFMSEYGPAKSGDYNVTLTYLAFAALHEALTHQPDDVKAYLYREKFSGWVDDYSFDSNGDVVSDKITFVMKTIRGGRPVPLED